MVFRETQYKGMDRNNKETERRSLREGGKTEGGWKNVKKNVERYMDLEAEQKKERYENRTDRETKERERERKKRGGQTLTQRQKLTILSD